MLVVSPNELAMGILLSKYPTSQGLRKSTIIEIIGEERFNSLVEYGLIKKNSTLSEPDVYDIR